MEVPNPIISEENQVEETPATRPSDVGFRAVGTTSCDHQGHYRLDGHAEGNLVSVICQNCWHGCMVDPTIYGVINGNLLPKKKLS